MTLTESAYWVKRIGIILSVILLILIAGVYIVATWEEPDPPSPIEQANYACTQTKEQFLKHKLKIPSLELAKGSTDVYTIETESGKVDAIPRIVNVYHYNNPGETLNSKGEAQSIAEGLGFKITDMQRKGTSEYLWEDPLTARRLIIQARNVNFTLEADFSSSKTFPENKVLPENDTAQQIAINFLQRNGLYYEEYMKGLIKKPILIEIQPDGTFKETTSKLKADLIRVDLFRHKGIMSIKKDDPSLDKIVERLQKLDNLTYKEDTIITSTGSIEVYKFETVVKTLKAENDKSYISIYVGPKDERKEESQFQNIYKIDYKHWEIEPDECGTYQLIPASTAINKVQNGEGSLMHLRSKIENRLTNYDPKVVTNFTIFEVDLAYYDPAVEQFDPETRKQGFLQPIYVVSGEATFDNGQVGNFTYYVPAIDYENIENKQVQQQSTGNNSQDSIDGEDMVIPN